MHQLTIERNLIIGILFYLVMEYIRGMRLRYYFFDTDDWPRGHCHIRAFLLGEKLASMNNLRNQKLERLRERLQLLCCAISMVAIKQMNVAMLDVYSHGHPVFAHDIERCIQKLSTRPIASPRRLKSPTILQQLLWIFPALDKATSCGNTLGNF